MNGKSKLGALMSAVAIVLALWSMALTLSPAAAQGCYVQTPFGQAWICSGPAPSAPVVAQPAPVAAFQPTFISATISGFGGTYPLNSWYFATDDTAKKICDRLLCAAVIPQACEFGGGPYTCSARENTLLFKDGLIENAGILASFFTRNPEGQFPGVAMSLINAQLASDRAARQR